MFKKSLSLLAAAGLLVTLLAGCSGGDSKTSSAPSASSASAAASSKTKITVEGSTSVTPLMEQLVEEYQKTHSVEIPIQGNGSSAGITAATEGRAMIGMSSRELKAEEKAALTETTIALDGIAVVTHKNNTVSDLSVDQISKIFKGEIKNWSEVGGPSKPIVVVCREAGSGTRSAFEELMKLQEKSGDKTISLISTNASIVDSNGAMKSSVAGNENAIGFMSLGSVDETVSKVKVDGQEATDQAIQEGKYKISRPFLLLTKGEPTGAVKEFIDFIKSAEGQKIVSQNYITVQ